MAILARDTSTASTPSASDFLEIAAAWNTDHLSEKNSTEYCYEIVRMISNKPSILPTAFDYENMQHEDVHMYTRIRLRRIAQESREHTSESGVEVEVERRAELLLERVWVSDAGTDATFRDSTFVTITGDGAVQFEWESEMVAIEVIVRTENFTIYIYRDGEEAEEHYPTSIAETVTIVAQGWGSSAV